MLQCEMKYNATSIMKGMTRFHDFSIQYENVAVSVWSHGNFPTEKDQFVLDRFFIEKVKK
jgi:hypothetical protein